jgi:hypothetical protein
LASLQSQRNPGTQTFLKNELASLRHDLGTIEDLVTKADAIPTLLPRSRRAGHQSASIPARDAAKHATRNVRLDTLNYAVDHEPKVLDTVEALTARMEEVIESSEETVQQSRLSIRELKDMRRDSRKLMKKFKKAARSKLNIRAK